MEVAAEFPTVKSLARHHARVWLIVILFLAGMSLMQVHALDRVDQEFAARIGSGADRPISDVLLDGQSRIVLAGDFTEFNGTPARGLVRLNHDGSIDPTFVPNLIPSTQGTPRLLVVHRDGYILATSDALQDDRSRGPAVWRLFADGSLDPAFATQRLRFENGTITQVAVDADGRILAAGSFTFPGSFRKTSLVRLLETGARDETFHSPSMDFATALALLPDGRILLAGSESEDGVQRLLPDGTREWPLPLVDTRDGSPGSLLLLPDGRLLVPNVIRTGTRSDFGQIRLGRDLEPDYTFDTREWLNNYWGLRGLVLTPDGGIYALNTTGYPASGEILRFGAGGARDPRFPAMVWKVADFNGVGSRMIAEGDSHLLVTQPTASNRWLLSRILLRLGAESAPVFLSQPSINVPLGETAWNVLPGHLSEGTALDLAADVLANPEASLQWQKNGVNIPGAAFPILSLRPRSIAVEGEYRLIATNRLGAITSEVATVLIDPRRPSLLGPVQLPMVLPGSPVTLEPPISGSPPLQVFWMAPSPPRWCSVPRPCSPSLTRPLTID